MFLPLQTSDVIKLRLGAKIQIGNQKSIRSFEIIFLWLMVIVYLLFIKSQLGSIYHGLEIRRENSNSFFARN